MTLVARFARNDVSFMLGDALLSVPKNTAISANLPMILPAMRAEMEWEFSYQESAPIGLMQKIVVIGRRLVIGWAGDVSVAERLIANLRSTLVDFESCDDVSEA